MMKPTDYASKLRNALNDCLKAKTPKACLEDLSDEEIRFFAFDWLSWARADQVPPVGTGAVWKTWLVLGGRGAGKTRAGAEWVRAMALGVPPFADTPAERIALVGETLHDVESVMVEGTSGILAVHPPEDRPDYKPSKRTITWKNGSIAQLFSSEQPNGLRGPQFHAAWCDELAKWRLGQETWDMLQFGLRLGEAPRQVVTTTPRPSKVLKQILQDKLTIVSRARTEDNASNLAGSFLRSITDRYKNTRLGRQELDGELIEDFKDALWRRKTLETYRLSKSPPLSRVVVAIDPPVTSGERADACGIVVAGLALPDPGGDKRGARAFVLADKTVQGVPPLEWARIAVNAFHMFEADALVAEVNQGGDLVELVIRQIDPDIPVRKVRATRGKWTRAEPVSALYAQGRVAHIGQFPALEDQMCQLGPEGRIGGRSPDRVDALVWAITELLLRGGSAPRIRRL